MSDDWFYTETSLRNIVYNATRVHVKEEAWSDFHVFAQLFTIYSLRNGDYLADVAFNELTIPARERLVIDAFKLWTSYKVEAGLL